VGINLTLGALGKRKKTEGTMFHEISNILLFESSSDMSRSLRIRRVHYKSSSYLWSLHIKNMYLSLSQACFTTIRGSSEFGRNNSIRVTFASIHKHDAFIICMHGFLRVHTYVYVKVHTETDRTWDTHRLHNTNISRKIKRNRAGLFC